MSEEETKVSSRDTSRHLPQSFELLLGWARERGIVEPKKETVKVEDHGRC